METPTELRYALVDGLRVYDIPDDLGRAMLRRVAETRPRSYPLPDRVAAVVLTARGNLYEGVSYHTAIMALTMHAEATALAHAAIHGETEIAAITGPNCHACKQLIWESAVNSGVAPVVITADGNGLRKTPIMDLMPEAWPENPWRGRRGVG